MEYEIKDPKEDPKRCRTITWLQKLSFRKEAKLGDIPEAKKDEYIAVPLDEPKRDIEPPDGGFWAWVIVLTCFLCNGLAMGINNAYGVIYVRLEKDLRDGGDQNAASKAALIGSLTFGSTLCCSPIAGILVDKIGIRLTVFIGGAVATASLFVSSFVTDQYEVLCLTYGFGLGFGLSMIYSPSLTMVGHYWKKRFGIINGVVTSGSAVFTLAMYYVLEFLMDEYNLAICFRILSGMMAIAMPCALTFKPVLDTQTKTDTGNGLRSLCSSIINLDNWKNPKYVIWVLSIFFGLFGYLVPLVHLVKFVQDKGIDVGGKELLIILQVCSLVARICFGPVADIAIIRKHRIMIQQAAFLVMGVLTMLLNITNSYPVLIVFCIGLGLADGCFWVVEGPIAYDICGPSGAAQAIGFLKGLMGISFAAGPPIAGAIYDHTGNYLGAFIGAGIPPIISAIVMTFASRR